MIYHVTVVLSLCLCLLSPWAANAQTAPAPTDDPLGDVVSDDGPAAEPTAPAAPPAAEEEPAAPAPAEQGATPASAPPDQAPPPPPAEPPYPAPAATPEPEQPAATPAVAESAALGGKDQKAVTDTGEHDRAHDERCAQLMAQGQAALAQAEGCGGGDQSIWAGTTVSFTQTTAPAYRTQWDPNPFYGLGLTFAPRLTINQKWALNADASLGYEVTQPDDSGKQEVMLSDTRLTLTGNLGTLAGLTFTGGPRVVIPTSKMSWAGDVYAGTGAALNIIKNFDVLAGWAFIAGGSYIHTFSDNLTRERRGDGENGDRCQGPNNEFIACAASGARLIQDSFRVVGATSLNVTPAVNFQLSYVYGWNLVKPFNEADPEIDILSGPAPVSDNVLPDERWSKFGSLGLSASYQPTTWFIGSLQASTSVCYASASGGQSALFGGCSGGMKVSSQALRNPIANKFSTVGLQFTIPLDALYDRIKNRGVEEKKTAAAKRAAKL